MVVTPLQIAVALFISAQSVILSDVQSPLVLTDALKAAGVLSVVQMVQRKAFKNTKCYYYREENRYRKI